MFHKKVEKLAGAVPRMGRAELIRILGEMRCGFKLDFTDGFLKSVSLDRLRHIILAAALHDRNRGAVG